MVLRWFCFVFILIQFVVWFLKRVKQLSDCDNTAARLGAIIGTMLGLVGYLGALYFILFSQFI